MSRHEVFPDPVAGDIWRERWCGTCFQPDAALLRVFQHGTGCPILAQALGGTVPPQWTRGRDTGLAADLYRCDEYLGEPEVYRVPREQPLPQDELFGEPEHQDKRLIPVGGWPDRSAFNRWQFDRRDR